MSHGPSRPSPRFAPCNTTFPSPFSTTPQFVAPFLAILAPAARPRFPPCIRDPAIGALDAALAVHPARPALKLVWRVSLSVRGFTQHDITGFFDGFLRMVRGALPGAHAQGSCFLHRGKTAPGLWTYTTVQRVNGIRGSTRQMLVLVVRLREKGELPRTKAEPEKRGL
ncbi:hypothetical protein B0H14DRAFT_3482308 [Mycena olivaceomarginata]|nr:hypothetical protein B0H14DRAFT_3482308 [Mycena olivaceomarginata]